MRRVVPVAVGLALLGAGSAHAASSYTVATSGGSVARIGSFRPGVDPTIGAATRAFGRPSSRTPTGDDVCVVTWRRLRLRVVFASFGAARPGRTTCTSGVGRAQSVTLRGRRFRTWRGLRVGDRSATIPRRHPGARFRQGSWWLRTATSVVGDESEYGVLRAIVSRGRVTALTGWIGAAGD